MDNHLNLGTFSSSLRDRPIWKVLGPIITASSGRLKEENAFQTSDVNFHQETSTRALQVLVLSSCSLVSDEKQSTILRLRQFATSDHSSCSRKAIVFLLSEDAFTSASVKYDLDGLFALQVLLFESLANPLPVIPVADAPSFFSSIQEYMANLDDIPVDSPTLGDSIVLLSCATTGYPGALCEQTTNILSDLFPSFRTLSQATHTSEGRGLLGDYLGEQTAENIIRFWQKDISME